MKKIICVWIIGLMCLLSGCDKNELESNAFPLAMGIEVAEEQEFHMYMAYPNLQDKDALENALSKDLYWDGTMDDLLSGTEIMSQSSNRNVDLNHLKVLILDKKVLDGDEEKEQLITFFREKRDAAWNTYVLLTDGDMSKIFSDEMQLNSCLGIYLEDLLEGWQNLKSGTLITVGDLMSQYFNQNERMLIPVVSVEDAQPVVKTFEVVERLNCISEMTMEEVFEKYDTLQVRLSE